MESIRPFSRSNLEEAGWVFSFLRNGSALLLSFMLGLSGKVVTFNAWVESNISIKYLRQGLGTRAELPITRVRADVCFASSLCYPSPELSFLFPTLFLATDPPPLLCPGLHNIEREHPTEFAHLLLKTHQNAYFIIQL